MAFNRRRFLRWSAAASVGVGAAACTASAPGAQGATDRPGSQGGANEGGAVRPSDDEK